MAARRLIFVMIVMLMLSSFAAALVPVRESDEETSTSTSVATVDSQARGRLVEARIDASAREPKTIRIELGDQLTLTVASDTPGEIEIPELGELEDAEAGTPAHFDLLPFEAGTYEVRLVEPERLLGRIVVESSTGKAKPREDEGKLSRGPTTPA